MSLYIVTENTGDPLYTWKWMPGVQIYETLSEFEGETLGLCLYVVYYL
jgi:hypothetical protein